MRKLLVSSDMSKKCVDALKGMGYCVMAVPSFSVLSKPVMSHPDMLMHYVNGKLILSEDYYNSNKEFFDGLGVLICTDDVKMKEEYPFDIAFDALGVGKVLYGKENFVSTVLKNEFERFVSVKQGYTRCSVLYHESGCAITSDEGIAKALIKDGIRVLRISEHGIALEGYNCGFIGGASGVCDETVFFFGDVMTHPCGEMIMTFLKQNKIKAVSLSDEPLSDYGGFICI